MTKGFWFRSANYSEIDTNHPFQSQIQDLVFVNKKKKKPCQVVAFTFSRDQRESEIKKINMD